MSWRYLKLYLNFTTLVPQKNTVHSDRLVIRLVVDIGPLTKLVPTLEVERDPSTVILVADDDFTYSPIWATELARFCSPTTAVAVSSFTFTLDARQCWMYKAVVDHGTNADVLEAYLGIAVERSMFTDNFIREMQNAADHWTDNGPWMLADDLVVSFYLNASGVSLVNVRTTLLERGNGGFELQGVKILRGGLQDLHGQGIEESVEADECCGEEQTGNRGGVNCDANMRRYRKYHEKITSVVSTIDQGPRREEL